MRSKLQNTSAGSAGNATRKSGAGGRTRGAGAQGAAETVERGGREASDEHRVERVGEAAKETAQRAQAAARDTAAAVEDAGERARRSAADATAIMADSFQDMGHIWADYAQVAMRQSVEATQSLLTCRTFAEAVEVQHEFFRQSFETFLDRTARISEVSTEAALRAMRMM